MADDVRMWLPLERKSGTQGTDEWVTDVPISLTNRFHVAVLLFSYRWQVMSECGYRKNKKICTQGTAECVTAALSTFGLFL